MTRILVVLAGGLALLALIAALLMILTEDGLGLLDGSRERLQEAEDDPRVAKVLEVLGKRGPVLIVFGRFVPGVRFSVNAMMGITRMAVRQLFSLVGDWRQAVGDLHVRFGLQPG